MPSATLPHARAGATRTTPISKREADDLPNPHGRKWRGVAIPTADRCFTRDEYREWMKRGMIQRDAQLLYLSGYGCYVLVMPRPRRIAVQEEEAPAEVSQHETPTEGPAAGESGARSGDAPASVGPREPAARGGEERDEEGEEE